MPFGSFEQLRILANQVFSAKIMFLPETKTSGIENPGNILKRLLAVVSFIPFGSVGVKFVNFVII